MVKYLSRTTQPQRAGQNIRQLALKRRVIAIASVASAGLSVALPLVLYNAVNEMFVDLQQLVEGEPTSIRPPLMLIVLYALIIISGIVNGVHYWRLANRADQGARAEESVAQSLVLLERGGWQIDYGVWLGRGLGDADIVCTSPQGKTYVVDVKSHQGHITTDGQQLYRSYGSDKYPFEKPFLKLVMRQALQIKAQRKLTFVTPIIAFSHAGVSIPAGKTRNVYVVEEAALLSLLQRLG
ncbi:MAG: nuclease-related domain-containing protein [Elainellaceae cyanobacterium]